MIEDGNLSQKDQQKLKSFLSLLLGTNKIKVIFSNKKNSNIETIWNIETNSWTYRNIS